jgi:hypothetical protein
MPNEEEALIHAYVTYLQCALREHYPTATLRATVTPSGAITLALTGAAEDEAGMRAVLHKAWTDYCATGGRKQTNQ